MALIGLDIKLETAIIAALAAILGGVVGASLKYHFDRRLQRHGLQLTHEFEQRRELKELITASPGSPLVQLELAQRGPARVGLALVGVVR